MSTLEQMTDLEDFLPDEISGTSTDSMFLGIEAYFTSLSSFWGAIFGILLTDSTEEYETQFDSLFQVWTPASDPFVAGLGEYQLLFGRLGNDVIYPYDHSLESGEKPAFHIDLMSGDAEVIKLFFLQEIINIISGVPTPGGKDRFVLGDYATSYYAQDGYSDFAFIFDYKPQEDVIQLRGTPEDYQVIPLPFLGSGIFERRPDSEYFWEDELVGIVFWDYALDLSGPGFQYVDPAILQEVSESKIHNVGTDGNEWITDLDVDASGNLIVGGITNGALVDGQKFGSYDNWLVKYDELGAVVWMKQFGSERFDSLMAIKTDQFGNIYVAGGTQGDLVAPKQGQDQDAWIAKYDPDGNQLWIEQFGSGFLNGISDIDINANGDVLVSGVVGKIDPRPDTNPNKVIDFQDDFFVAKFAQADGSLEWLTEVAAPIDTSVALWDEVYGVSVAPDGSIYAAGWTYGDHSGQGGFAYYDAHLTKFSPSGEFQWIKQFGTNNWDFGKSLGIDSQGNIYTYGWTDGDFSLGSESPDPDIGIPPLPAEDPTEDLWLAKYTPDGTKQWIKQFGTPGDDGALLGGLTIDANDQIYLTGYTNDSFGGDNVGGYDAWVASLDTDGNFIWKQQFGTSKLDYGTNIKVGSDRRLFVTGFSEGSLGGINQGAVDSWIAQLDAATGQLLQFGSAPSAPDENDENGDDHSPSDGDKDQNGTGQDDQDTIVSNAGNNGDLPDELVATVNLPGQSTQVEMLDLRELNNITLYFEVSREARYDNLLGFYIIENEAGQVRDELGALVTPGDPGYEKVALQNRVDVRLETENRKTSYYTLTIEQGQLWAPFLITDGGTIAAVLDDVDANDPDIYFSYASANKDGFDHVRASGKNTLGFEDLKGGGDKDFNDLIVEVSIF